MKYAVGNGHSLTLTAPSGGVVSGQLYIIGALPVVAQATVDEGELFAGLTTGEFEFPLAAVTVAEGDPAFYSASGHTVTDTSATGLWPIGTFTRADTSGAARGRVRLDGIRATAVPA